MEFVKSINKNISMTYIWQKMKILRNRKNIVNWNEWKDKNRLKTVREDMDKLGKPWVQEEELKLECNELIKFEI